MVCVADDLALNDTADRVYNSFGYKREKAAEGWHTSNLVKFKCYSPMGDMSLAPAHLARARLTTRVGACAGSRSLVRMLAVMRLVLLKAIQRKLKPLDLVEHIADGEHVKNAEQLQRYLVARCGGSIPLYWLQLMRPTVTEEAAIFAKSRFTQVMERMYNFEGSPADRASLTRRQCFFPADLGGMEPPTSPMPGLRAMPLPRMPHGAPPSPTSPPLRRPHRCASSCARRAVFA
eukprot:4173478-Prymnesium_polylepis.1